MTRNKKLVRLMAVALAATTVATAVPAYTAFDAEYYAQQNPDVVAKVGTSKKALENHYNLFGKNEGRASSAADVTSSPIRQLFDAAFYAKQNPDVVAVFGNSADALFNHFMAFGIKEGRQINQYFDVNAYKAAYPDLVAAYGDNIEMYYRHFATFGIKEHRTLGGFPAENILPSGAKVVAKASSGGGAASSGGSSGGGGAASSGGSSSSSSSSSSASSSTGLPTNVASTPKAVAAANKTISDELDKYRDSNGDIDKNKKIDSKAEKDALVASAQSALVAAQNVNTKAQADLATATTEEAKAAKALSDAENAVANSKIDGVKKFVSSQTQVAAVASAQSDYYNALKDLEDKKADQEKKATALTNAQAAANKAQAEYDTALQNAKDTYVAVSGNPASYIANRKPDDVISELSTLAGGDDSDTIAGTINTGITDEDKKIINAKGEIVDKNYNDAVKDATDAAKASVLVTYQLAFLNDIIEDTSSYGDADDAAITDTAKAELAKYGIDATGFTKNKITDNTLKNLTGADTDKLAKLDSTTIATKGTKDNSGKTISEAETAAVATAKKGIDDNIDKYKAAVSKEAFEEADATLNGGKIGGETVTGAKADLTTAEGNKKTADTAVETAEKAVTNADKAVKTAEEARDKAYSDDGVAGNAELATRDAAQANEAKETYEKAQAQAAAQTAQQDEDDAYKNYDDATSIVVK